MQFGRQVVYGLPLDLPVPEEIDREIENGTNSILQRVGSGKVKAFVLLALEEGGKVTVNTSTQVKPYVYPLMLDWARSHLARTYESAVNDEMALKMVGPAADIQFPFGDKEAPVSGKSLSAVDSGSAQAPRKAKARRATPYRTMKRTRAALSQLSTADPSTSSTTRAGDTGDASPPVCKLMHSFRINEEDKVKKYLEQKLDSVQQNPDKYIAKAWIKGICPRKQAKFPYKCKQRQEKEGKSPEWPGWWPIEVCEFKEPDHVVKPQRIALCLHLLRLRPTPEKLDVWHSETREPNKVHIEQGWTAFLRELAPPSVMDELEPERPEKAKCLRKELERMYKVAQMEEDFKNDARDGADLIQLDDDELVIKDSLESRASKPRKSKRLKLDPQQPDSAGNTRLAGQLLNIALTEGVSSDGGQVLEQSGSALMAAGNHAETAPPTWITDGAHPRCRGIGLGGLIDYRDSTARTTQYVSGSLTTSFGSTQSDQGEEYDARHVREAPTTFPSRQDYAFAQAGQGQDGIQVHQVTEIPYPRFDTMTYTPAFSPASTMHFQHYESAPFQDALRPRAPMFGLPYDTHLQAFQGAVQPGYEAQHQIPVTRAQEYFDGSTIGQDFQHVATSAQLLQTPSTGQFWQHPQQVPTHGLPSQYERHVLGPPNDDLLYRQEPPNLQHHPFVYEGQRPDSKIPAAALPRSVERGFTDHGSGIGGGAWV